ncbi:hypothetical protein Dia5BBH33_00940 [Dialister hominis]|uniref:Uncharacterized protein n=1 Tax=Dialister hominis TaxID=2582419 RepID=A0A8D5A3L8_9FIRM|nr:hypothetical protein Dia5BBH33_00940 [Dialister hominis]
MEIISWLFLIWDILAWEGLKKCHLQPFLRRYIVHFIKMSKFFLTSFSVSWIMNPTHYQGTVDNSTAKRQ